MTCRPCVAGGRDLKERLGLFPDPDEASLQRQAKERDQVSSYRRSAARGCCPRMASLISLR